MGTGAMPNQTLPKDLLYIDDRELLLPRPEKQASLGRNFCRAQRGENLADLLGGFDHPVDAANLVFER